MNEQKDRFIRALRRESVDQTPVWMMRQAGRYLPEYRATRSRAGDFMSLCQSPDLACEVTLQPLTRYPQLDAAILFSDILTIPDAMGLGLYFEAQEGPKFKSRIKSLADVQAIPQLKIEVDLDYVVNAVKTIRGALNGRLPLIGFSGSPWTLATYMIEGGSSKDFRMAKTMLYQKPDVLHALLEKLTHAVTDYLCAQIRAGAQVVQIFDTWGGILSDQAYLQFSLSYMAKIAENIKTHFGDTVPIILFTKNGGMWLESMVDTGVHALGLDWSCHLGEVRKRVGHAVALQGNMDPSVLYADRSYIRDEVARLLNQFGPYNGHVFNLGHGITPEVNPDHVHWFLDAVAELSRPMHDHSSKVSH